MEKEEIYCSPDLIVVFDGRSSANIAKKLAERGEHGPNGLVAAFESQKPLRLLEKENRRVGGQKNTFPLDDDVRSGEVGSRVEEIKRCCCCW